MTRDLEKFWKESFESFPAILPGENPSTTLAGTYYVRKLQCLLLLLITVCEIFEDLKGLLVN